MEISIKLNEVISKLDESLNDEIEKKVALAIQNIQVETITKLIEKQIMDYDFQYVIENALDDIDISEVKVKIQKTIIKTITEKLK